jgi:hypothetical protein
MSSLRVKLSSLTTKKVPALSLLLVAVVGMAVGVFAATITVTTTNNAGGEQGFLHTTGSVLTFTDSGLSVVGTAPTTNTTSNFLTSGNKNAFTAATTFTAGHWEEAIKIADTSGDTASHTVTVNITQGTTAPSGTAFSFSPFTYTVVGVTGSTNPTITLYMDMGATSITTPLNIYISST